MPARKLPALIICLVMIGQVWSCGQMRPPPPTWVAGDYTPIEFSQLQSASPDLAAGHKISCRAYFWQFLEYDPAPGYYYFNQLRHPLSWGDLEWFALYGSPDMQNYFDRAAMDEAQQRAYQLRRMDPIILYGELVPLGGRQVYLRVHHIQQDEPE
ncbi:MAG: hypothetical protein BZ151_02670 [Desulfobacca sp. 4484_104]|nr:MAG: hypothetical protein BZ151_02670 [Desulfobacca sp. 4484_104]